jgi:hypothetical protein
MKISKQLLCHLQFCCKNNYKKYLRRILFSEKCFEFEEMFGIRNCMISECFGNQTKEGRHVKKLDFCLAVRFVVTFGSS